MARDRARRRIRRSQPGSPVDQLDLWSSWRHDTAELPLVRGDHAATHAGSPRPVDDVLSVRPARVRHRGVLLGAAGLLAALTAVVALGLTGTGPAAELLAGKMHSGSASRRSGSGEAADGHEVRTAAPTRARQVPASVPSPTTGARGALSVGPGAARAAPRNADPRGGPVAGAAPGGAPVVPTSVPTPPPDGSRRPGPLPGSP